MATEVNRPVPEHMPGWDELDRETQRLVRSACRLSYQRALGCPEPIIGHEKDIIIERFMDALNKDDIKPYGEIDLIQRLGD